MAEEELAVEGPDFFISYTRVDEAWAEWIAWVLQAGVSKEAGF
jgi:hypothetical protein